ncbi:MAG TPA: NIPSNAP family containing protein [Actinomycetota bacterium]|nr:NIPSNAP family containing protein [Actinomycetota bacterium]
MATQLRDFKIRSGRMDDFVRAWRDSIVPLRREHGFRSTAWTVPGENRFVWLLESDGTERDFEARDAAYYASEARSGVQVDPRQWIEDHAAVFLSPVPLG